MLDPCGNIHVIIPYPTHTQSTDVMKRLAERWSNADEEEKRKYQKMQQEEKERYTREMTAFEATGQQTFLQSLKPQQQPKVSTFCCLIIFPHYREINATDFPDSIMVPIYPIHDQ